MKTATLPSLRVEPGLRKAAEGVLREGESLSSFMEQSLRDEVNRRRMQAEFIARGLAARDEVRSRLDGEGIPTMIHYPLPVHLQPAYRDPASGRPIGVHLGPGGLPVTERICREIVSLPMHPQLTDDEAGRVGAALARLAGPGVPPA